MNPGGSEVGKFITFSLSSAGYNTLSLSYATRISGSSTGVENWSYSIDGINYLTLGSITPTAGSFGLSTLNLSGLSTNTLNNQSAFYLRMAIGTGTSASYAFDNFQLTGNAVPEPSSAALLGAFGALFLFRRRR